MVKSSTLLEVHIACFSSGKWPYLTVKNRQGTIWTKVMLKMMYIQATGDRKNDQIRTNLDI
jgi:hypothetical protein